MATPSTRTIETRDLASTRAKTKAPGASKTPQLPNCHRLLASLSADETNHKGLLALLRSGAAVPAVGFKDPDPELGLLWGKLSKLRLADEAIGDLFSAAIQFSDAHYMQAAHAFLRKGGELPEHFTLKKQLREDRRPPSATGGQPLSRNLLMEIEAGEADRLCWTDRRVKSQMRRLADLAAKLHAALTEVVSSTRLYARAERVLSDPLLEGIRTRLRRLQDVGSAEENIVDRKKGPEADKRYSQPALHVYIRKAALTKMVVLAGKRWTLFSKLIYEASGKTFAITSNDLSSEYMDLPSAVSSKKPGVVTRKSVKSPDDRI